MKKILVTGGTGFIGSHTVVELHNAGYEPILIDNFSNSERSVLQGIKNITNKDFSFYEADCNDPNTFQSIFREHKIEGVIHFAAYKAVGESVKVPLKYYNNNINSLINLLESMLKFEVNNLVFSSSCTVYGQPDSLPVTEDAPIKKAESPYGNTKQICEEIIVDTCAANASLHAISLRYFNPIGAHPSAEIGELPLGIPGNLVPFITQTAAGIREKLTVFGNDYHTPDGSCIRDYIHVVDLAKAHVKAFELLDKKTAGFYDFFNIGTGKGSTVLEVVKGFEKVTGKNLNYWVGPRRPGDVEKVYAAVDKSSKELDWKTELDLETALIDAWRWEQRLQQK
ncbi:MAG TPA: UDP-glucose 4-epimerase GalE [Cytophagales bacterium]|nr:UDP-glucose 4-epimerase GalE [Cytophagales bacterium]